MWCPRISWIPWSPWKKQSQSWRVRQAFFGDFWDFFGGKLEVGRDKVLVGRCKFGTRKIGCKVWRVLRKPNCNRAWNRVSCVDQVMLLNFHVQVFPPKNAQEMSFSTFVLPPPKLWLLTWVVDEDLWEFLIYVLGFGAKIPAFPPFFIHVCYFIPQGVSGTW